MSNNTIRKLFILSSYILINLLLIARMYYLEFNKVFIGVFITMSLALLVILTIIVSIE